MNRSWSDILLNLLSPPGSESLFNCYSLSRKQLKFKSLAIGWGRKEEVKAKHSTTCTMMQKRNVDWLFPVVPSHPAESLPHLCSGNTLETEICCFNYFILWYPIYLNLITLFPWVFRTPVTGILTSESFSVAHRHGTPCPLLLAGKIHLPLLAPIWTHTPGTRD